MDNVLPFLGYLLGLVLTLGIIALVVWAIVLNFNVFKKAGFSRWKLLIPFYNTYVWGQIAQKAALAWALIVLGVLGSTSDIVDANLDGKINRTVAYIEQETGMEMDRNDEDPFEPRYYENQLLEVADMDLGTELQPAQEKLKMLTLIQFNSLWIILAFVVVLASVVLHMILNYHMARRFGQSELFSVLSMFFGFICFAIIGYKKSIQYQGELPGKDYDKDGKKIRENYHAQK